MRNKAVNEISCPNTCLKDSHVATHPKKQILSKTIR